MEPTIEVISKKPIAVIPLIPAPPLRYSSEFILGERQPYQEKIYLRMVAIPGGILYYDATKSVAPDGSPLYVPTDFSLGQTTGADIDSFLARLVYLAFEEKVSPDTARSLNVSLGNKLERILLRPREIQLTE